MWKILLTFAAIMLVGSSILSFVNMGRLSDIKSERVASDDANQTKHDELTKTEDSKTETESKLADVKGQADALEAENEILQQQISAKDEIIGGLESENDDLEQELTLIEEKAGKVEEIRATVAEVQELQTQVDASTATLSANERTFASLTASLDNLEVQRKARQEQLQGLSGGEIYGDFTAGVRQTYPENGFVVLDSGGNQGVVRDAVLDVVRGGQQIAKLKVTNVERDRSVADILPDSMVPGESISPGDRVYKTIKTDETKQ